MSDRAVDLVEQYLNQPSWARSPYLRVQAREIVARVRAADSAEAAEPSA